MEPPKKLRKMEDLDIKAMLLNMQASFTSRLKSIEDKIEKMSSKYQLLEEKVEDILCQLKESAGQCSGFGPMAESSIPNLIASNSEGTYPDGSWLGDPLKRHCRVRCNISPVDLENINTSCTTPEKMALTLLDNLFDRETQAVSNLSGTGKHGKKQLDPLKIFAIKSHLMYIFGITNKDWLKIRLNLDSKCRTAFRRKLKGMPLSLKGCRERERLSSSLDNSSQNTNDSSFSCQEQERLPSSLDNASQSTHENSPKDSCLKGGKLITKGDSHTLELFEQNLHRILPIKLESAATPLSLTESLSLTQIIHTEHGDIQVIQATEEQLEQLKQNHQIEILSHAEVITDQT